MILVKYLERTAIESIRIITESLLLVEHGARGAVLKSSLTSVTLAVNLGTTTLGEQTILLPTLIAALRLRWEGVATARDVPGPVADLHHRVEEGSLLACMKDPLASIALAEGIFAITLREISIITNLALMVVAWQSGRSGPWWGGLCLGGGQEDVVEEEGGQHEALHPDYPM